VRAGTGGVDRWDDAVAGALHSQTPWIAQRGPPRHQRVAQVTVCDLAMLGEQARLTTGGTDG
jgi:hypothetical protein